MGSVKRAVILSAVGQYSLQIINFIAVVVLARLLTPDQIGLFAVATSIAFVASNLTSFGAAEYLVREKEVNEEKIRQVIGVMMIMSWGLGLILLSSSMWIADFYGEKDLQIILWIITIPFFFVPYTSVPYALITRDMNFDAILRVNLGGTLVRSAVSVGMVLYGHSYFGLAYGTLLGSLTELIIVSLYRPKNSPWAPSFSGISRIFNIGIVISAAKFLTSTSQNASDLVLGRLSTMYSVGMFSRGLGLILFLHSLLVKAVSPVALPHLSEVQRRGGSVKDAYLKAIVMVGAVTIPVFAVVNLSAGVMIDALFGDQWEDSVEIAQVLSVWVIIVSIHCFSNPLLLTTHNEKYYLVKEAVSIITKVILIILAIPAGLKMVAWAYCASSLVDFLVISVITKRIINLDIFEVVRAFSANFLVAGACWLFLKLLITIGLINNINSWLALLLIAATMAPLWLACIWLTKNPIWNQICGLIKDLSHKIIK